MRTVTRVLVLLGLAGATAAVPAAPPAAPALPPDLAAVPPDAALFLHADVAAVWASPIGATVKAAKSKGVDEATKQFTTALGVGPDAVKTVTLCLPKFQGETDLEGFHAAATFAQPIDKFALMKWGKANLGDKVWADVGGRIYWQTVRDQGRKTWVLDASDPLRLTIYHQSGRREIPDPTATGPTTPAIRAAADGAPFAAALNFAQFPPEVRGETLPAEVRPFRPLFLADGLTLTGRFDQGTLRFEFRAAADAPAKVLEAEKSIGVGLDLIRAGLLLADLEIAKQAKAKPDDAATKGALALVRALGAAFQKADVASADGAATARVALPADLPFAPVLEYGYGSRESAAADQRQVNALKQIGLALHNYHDVYGALPPAALVDKKGRPLLSWRVLILPYLEQDALYKQFKLDEPWDGPTNKPLLAKIPAVFADPAAKPGATDTRVRAFVGNGALFDPLAPTKFTAVTDGLSNTLFAAVTADAVPWSKPDDVAFDPDAADPHAWFRFEKDRAAVLLADGSVRRVKKSVAADTLKGLVTKSGGEVLPDY